MAKIYDFQFRQFSKVEKILDDAKEVEFDSIIMVGVKDGIMYHSWANVNDPLQVIGAIEVIKTHLIDSIGDEDQDTNE